MSSQASQTNSAGTGSNAFGCGIIATGFTSLIATSLPQQVVASVATLANDIVHFNTKVPIYYPATQQAADALSANPTDPKAQQTVQSIMSSLAGSAGDMTKAPDAVTASINNYTAGIPADKQTLATLITKYDDQDFATSIEAASARLDEITSSLNAAVLMVEEIKAGWDNLSQTFKQIGATVQSNPQEALTLIENNPLDEASKEWATLSEEANNYRLNAFVKR